jgi:CheY-like chemotaxis protein
MTKILLVEDNEMNQDMLSRRLQRRGYELVFAMDGEKGVSIAQSELPDLILMDISLPVMDGWEATRRLKAEPNTRSIPIIALTAHAMVGDREKCVAAGCDDYDTKPVELSRLLEKMEKLLANRQANPQPQPQAVSPTPPPPPRPSAQPTATPPIANCAIDPSSATILVVDDNEMNRDMLGRRLERSGYTVLLATGGQEGLDIIEQQPVDLVLLDIMMPDMSGIETLKIIRSRYSMAQLPVIMATAKDRSEDMIEAFDLGANDYVTKPIDLPILLSRVQSHLRTIQSARQAQPADPTAIAAIPTAAPEILVTPADTTGHLLLGRYQITQQLSQDYFRNTYLAQDIKQLNAPPCLVERLHIHSDRPELVIAATEQWQQEVRVFQEFNNSNIARIIAAFNEDRFFYMIQECVEGTSLLDKFQGGKSLSLPDALSLILEMLEILQTLHRSQLIHQHLQPLCFLCSVEGKLNLLDLGIASRLAYTLQQTNRHSVNIYHPYVQQSNNLSLHSDIYAVATITLQALTGTPPNQMPIDPVTGELRWRHLRIVAESFARILNKMISKDPNICYHSIDSILNDLYQLPMVSTILGRERVALS